MSIVQADVLQVAPELRTADPAIITSDDWTRVLADVDNLVNDNYLGTTLGRLARMWLAAHMLAVEHPELCQVGQPRAYEVFGKKDFDDPRIPGVTRTRFGREYLRIIKTTTPMSVL